MQEQDVNFWGDSEPIVPGWEFWGWSWDKIFRKLGFTVPDDFILKDWKHFDCQRIFQKMGKKSKFDWLAEQ